VTPTADPLELGRVGRPRQHHVLLEGDAGVLGRPDEPRAGLPVDDHPVEHGRRSAVAERDDRAAVDCRRDALVPAGYSSTGNTSRATPDVRVDRVACRPGTPEADLLLDRGDVVDRRLDVGLAGDRQEHSEQETVVERSPRDPIAGEPFDVPVPDGEVARFDVQVGRRLATPGSHVDPEVPREGLLLLVAHVVARARPDDPEDAVRPDADSLAGKVPL
jgi:hypothetical protein